MKKSIPPYLLTKDVVYAIGNDKHLKETYRRLNDLHAKAIPKTIQVSPTEFQISFGDEIDELIVNLHKEIDFRQRQIISSFNSQEISITGKKG